MKNIIFKIFLLGVVVSAAFTSCVKDDYDTGELGDAGTTYVKVLEGKQVSIFLSPFSDIARVNLFTLRRDVNSNSALNSTNTVTLEFDAAAITEYNTANKTSFVLLPDALYTITNQPGVQKTSTGLEVTFLPGEFSKEVAINLDGGKFDLSKTYALAYKMKSGTGLTISGTDKVLAAVSIKNKYDGKYTVNGSVVREGDPVLSGAFPEQEYILLTAGPNTLDMNRNAVWASGSAIGGIGPFRLTLNPTTNVITVTDAVNAGVVNNPAGINKYDPATKTFQISVFWGNGPQHRAWEAKFVYKGPR
ncbi:DUF1735 domain-containing protein [Daejeonella sp.]|uniref:DUF1735 domain-containing protein n=1 Tax=Daejeonella sp. TaxID=2805397 RepID=UPI0030BCCD65